MTPAKQLIKEYDRVWLEIDQIDEEIAELEAKRKGLMIAQAFLASDIEEKGRDV